MLRSASSLAVLVIAASVAGCRDDETPAGSPASSPAGDAPGTIGFVSAAAARIKAAKSGAPEARVEGIAAAQRLIASGRFREARGFLEPVHAKFPELLQPAYLIGLTHHKEKRYAEALPYYEAVLAGRPAFPSADDVLYMYAWAEFYNGRTDLARAAFEATLAARPDKVDAEFGVGLCALDETKLDEAARHFESVIATATRALEKGDRSAADDAAKAHARLADVLEMQDDLAGARRHYEESVALNPSLYEAWFRLSKVLERQGETDKAADAKAEADRWHAAAEQHRKENP